MSEGNNQRERTNRFDCTMSFQYVKGENIFTPVRGKKPLEVTQDSDKNQIMLITPEDFKDARSDIIIKTSRHNVLIQPGSSLPVLYQNSLIIPSKKSLLKMTGAKITSCKAGIDAGVIGLPLKRDDNVTYLCYYLGSPVFLECLEKENLKDISTRFLLNHQFPVPPRDIQDIIVKLLKTIDVTINDTDRIIRRTHDALKGLLQGLFSNGVRKTAFIETEIGRIPDTWEVRSLHSLCQILKKGGTPSKSISNYWQGDIAWVAPSDIVGRKMGDDMEFVTKEAIDSAGSWIVPAKNILVVRKGDVGAAVITEEDMAIHNDIYGIIPVAELEPLYLYWYLFKKERYFTRFRYESPPTISRKELGSLLIPLPPRDEQRQIASVMNTLDKKLEHEHRYKNQMITLREVLVKSLFIDGIKK